MPIAPIGAVSSIESTAIISAVWPLKTSSATTGVFDFTLSNASEPRAAYKIQYCNNMKVPTYLGFGVTAVQAI